ncbi:MAG: N-acetylglucosamine-6-phosphate deacetylase [Clostridia bacterium]|nr:N-acetylglucosamine-6-phosphate deacetylase [Clostridia bacterium]MBQ8720109.1 N-acetylglucosamine-6-phosphate deacetylase [Clostridia bacterium]
MKAIKNVRLFGELTDICIDDGVILSVGKTDLPGEDFGGNKIYPGLIDIHAHGYIGYDTMEGHIDEMSRWLLSRGTTSWYPTTMTMSRSDILRATEVDISKIGGASVLGFHMEGPFINPDYKGAQNGEFITPPDLSLVSECKNVKIVTIAPELEGSLEFIKNCPAIVSLGHTAADYDTAKAAFDAGAKCLTHTFNAMPPFLHRAPGPIGAGADSEGAYAQLISDGKHTHPSTVRMLVKLFGEGRVILISDAMRATGLSDGEYDFGGQKITVTDGYARTDGGNLAGSTSTLFDCVRSAISFGISEEAAVKMASENPARLMGLNKGKIAEGYDADFIIVDDCFNLVKAIARGEV